MFNDLVDSQSRSKIVQYAGDHHTGPCDAGLAVTDIRIDGYVVLLVHNYTASGRRIMFSYRQRPYTRRSHFGLDPRAAKYGPFDNGLGETGYVALLAGIQELGITR